MQQQQDTKVAKNHVCLEMVAKVVPGVINSQTQKRKINTRTIGQSLSIYI
jgi:hypothetical protein